MYSGKDSIHAEDLCQDFQLLDFSLICNRLLFCSLLPSGFIEVS